VTTDVSDRIVLDTLERRIRTLLPEEYQDAYEERLPTPMRSAGLKFDETGKVAWDEIWGSFCDLALAGGPPHKGRLLEPGAPAAIDAEPERYDDVVAEICRGVTLATDLQAAPSPRPGWIRVITLNDGMAGWLLRAIVMENVAVRCDGALIDLPAAPHFRLEKEIKNVVTVIAKTCHYFLGHMPLTQRRRIAYLFATLKDEAPLVEPALGDGSEAGDARLEAAAAALAASTQAATGLPRSPHRYAGWLGLECPDVKAALWMSRALVVSNVLSRREDAVLFVPVDPVADADGRLVRTAVTRVRDLAAAKQLL
jgi:sirohydrochlorin cobaltochelatase